MNAGKITAGIIVALAVVAFFSIFIVKEVNQAIVLQFGDPKRIILKPGLNFKIPFIQNVVFLDKRILNLDTPPEEVIASDQKRLIVDAFARFQIVDPLKFYISVGNERVARSRLATIINSRIRNVLGQQELQTLLSEDRTKQMALIQEGVNNEAENFGIKIVDVRIKRADLPQANSDAIFRRMQTEREREAKEFRARGAEMAVTITSTADKEVTVILADAQKNLSASSKSCPRVGCWDDGQSASTVLCMAANTAQMIVGGAQTIVRSIQVIGKLFVKEAVSHQMLFFRLFPQV